MRDLANNIGIVQAIAPAVLAATTTSDPISRIGFESVAAVISTGAIAGAGDYTAKLQASETEEDEDFGNVSNAELIGAFPTSLEADSIVKVGYIGSKPHVRVVITKNSGTSIAANAEIVMGDAHNRPVA